jgi:hypothetical protein
MEGAAAPRGKLAVLVIAHANPLTFQRLADALRHPDIAVFVHVDSRSDISPFQAPGQDHVTFLADRQPNNWGAFTQIEVAARLLDAAQQAGPFASYALVSGDSLPLVTNDVLVDALGATPTAFRLRIQKPDDRSYRRVRDVYLPDSTIGRIRGLGSHLDRCLEEADVAAAERAIRTAAIKRNLPFEVYKGSQWFAISDDHLRRVFAFVRDNPDFVEVFRYSLIPDELFFHSALQIVDPAYASPGGIMEVDWTRKPKPFALRDPQEIELVYASRALFFRKFSDKGLELVDAVLAARVDRRGVRQLGSGTAWRFLRGARAAARLAAGTVDDGARDEI